MLRKLLILVAAALSAAPAAATIVMVQMFGTWTNVTDYPQVLDGSMSVGDSFSLTLTYDDQLVDDDPADCCGSYGFPFGGGVSQTGLSGNYSFSSVGDVALFVRNGDGGSDIIDSAAFNGYTISGPFPAGVYASNGGYAHVTLLDSSQTALDSDALTDVNWNLADYDQAYFSVEFVIEPVHLPIHMVGTITAIQVIPEPSTALLGALGLVGLVVSRSLRV